jgi:iron complex outermembrane receptor protein
MTSTPSRKSLFLITAAAAALCATGASAQSEPGASAAAAPAAADSGAAAAVVDDIVVTARRQTERAQDVPIALSVVSGTALKQSGGFTLSDLQNDAPSLVAYQSNARNSSIGIRGIGVSSAADGLDTAVGVYVDGVYLGRPGMALEDLIDVDQIEVLRGPQGTLYGRNTSAGVLNITTKKPEFNFNTEVEASVGNYGYNQERISLTGPIIDDKLAFRATAFNTHRDGVLPNTVTGIAGNSIGRTGARLQFLATPSDKVSIRLIGEYSNENDTCCVSSVKQVFSPSLSPGTQKTLTALAKLGYVPAANLTSSNGNSPQNMLTDQHSFSAEVDWDLGWADATSITAYRYWHFDPLQDSDSTPLDILQVNVAQTKDQQYSQEFRLASKPGRFSWQAGVYLFDQDLKDHYILNQFGRDASAFYTAYTGSPVNIAPGSQYIDDTHATSQSYAAFGQANYKLTDQLTLTGGVRYTYDSRHGVSNTSNLGTPYGATSTPFHYNVTVDGGNVSYLGSISYKLTRNSLIYGSYSTGYQSAGLNLNSATTTTNGVTPPLVLQPEKVGDWEVGVKQTLFDHHLSVDVDGYWTNLTGLQANYYPSNGSKSYLTNVGNVISRGVEAEGTLKLDNGFQLSVNGSYNDAYYSSYPNAPCPVGGAAVCNLTGRPVFEAPKWIGGVTAQYRFDLNDHVQPYALVQYSYRSSAFGTIDDGPLTKIPAYSLVNARIGASIAHGRYDLSFWVNNALNAVYFQNLGTLAGPPGTGTYGAAGQLGTPRTYGTTLRASF